MCSNTISMLVHYSSRFKIGIYYKHESWMEYIWNELLNYFKELNYVERCWISRLDRFIQLNNGIIYQFVATNDSSRGCKFDRIYYEAGIDREIIDAVIIPSLMPLVFDVSTIDRNGDNDGYESERV